MTAEARLREWTPKLLALALFLVAGLLESIHAFIGYQISGLPDIGYTLRGQPLTLLAIMARAMPSWLLLGILAALAARFAERRPLFSRQWRRAVAFHLPLAIIFSAVFITLAAAIRHSLFVGPEVGITFNAMWLRYYTVYFNTFFLFYWGIAGIYSGFVRYRDLRERDLHAETLQRQLTEARLRVLQQQLEPHFLYNTLNAVSGLAQDGNVSGTVRTLTLLGDLLRKTLRREEQLVTIAEELELMELYLAIQRIRLEERLQVRTLVEPQSLSALVPTFLLQPLIENAITHGIARNSRPGLLEIDIRRVGSHIRVKITDSGRGLESGSVRAGVGLNNCVARLGQLFGTDYRFDLRNADAGGAQVTLAWPFISRTSTMLPGTPESAFALTDVALTSSVGT
jgi:two-component system, LytTR family, sensor kinase